MINLCWCFCFFPESIVIQKYFTLNLVNVPIQIHGKMTASWWWIISIWCAIQMSLFLFSACCYSVDQLQSYMSACILFIEYFKEGFFFLLFEPYLKSFSSLLSLYSWYWDVASWVDYRIGHTDFIMQILATEDMARFCWINRSSQSAGTLLNFLIQSLI